VGHRPRARGEELSAGTADDEATKPDDSQKKDADAADAEKKAAGDGSEGRFLFITAMFDPELVTPPRELDVAVTPELPADPFLLPESGAITLGFESDVAKEALAREEKQKKQAAELEAKREEGRKQAQELSERFASWYYVVPGGAIRSIAVENDQLLKSTEPAPAAPRAPSGLPNFGLPGFPGQ
jgi:hypothetical protein